MPFVIALATAAALTPLAGLVGRSLGLVDRPGHLKIHRGEIPTLGGMAVVAAVAAASLWPDVTWPGWGLTVGLAIALATGTLDDVVSMSPAVRVFALTAAGITVVVGTGLGELGVAPGLAVVLLVLACANAVNILDGQDGLAAGVAGVGALGMAAILWGDAGSAPALPAALAGALLGFLAWNRPPARVYLGNGGAYAVGVLLAVPAVTLVVSRGWRGLLAAGACLAVPAFEVAFTVGRRAVSRESFSAGDRLHSYDLVSARIGRARSTVTFLVLATLGVGFALVVAIVPLPAGVALALAGAGLGALWGMRLWSIRSIPT